MLRTAQASATPSFLSDPSVVHRLLAADFDINALRVNDTLQKEEWILFDEAVLRVRERRRGLLGLLTSRADLRMNVENALGVMILQWNENSDMDPATRGMDPTAHGMRDRLDFSLQSLPVYATWKDFGLDIRTLAASRKMGQPLDVQHAEVATRLVLESLDDGFVNGPSITASASTAYGLVNHPNRNTASFESGNHWGVAAKTGELIMADVTTLRSAAKADRHYGPYAIVVPTDAETKLDEDYKANSDKTIRQRLLELGDVEAIVVDDFLPSDNVVLVQLTSDVIQLIDGEAPSLVSWTPGWGEESFKVLAIQQLRVRKDYDNRSGIVHMT